MRKENKVTSLWSLAVRSSCNFVWELGTCAPISANTVFSIIIFVPNLFVFFCVQIENRSLRKEKKLHPHGVYSCDQVVTLLAGSAHVHLLLQKPFFFYHKFCSQDICILVFISKIGL